ncbi:uncharacterized protein BP01DRAFT_354379 [Aspergillus saccharolyticus JOP 1030-1]|uniref:Uncharacterized protein n=1 Tax=Aspergillus saccharolyticus JOP 1030-1 TaxID=1450539 RepID=A0A318ZUZ3_9EURO|nr:hypothetical protein BP01DRAFT_354379 [Aspergillus saccharolyticus JOP 1030-1]PYH47840.1 hypothetical protein BP01DRAFT_354379 [Aspergillus saccharolyticus JOP 1030-1]
MTGMVECTTITRRPDRARLAVLRSSPHEYSMGEAPDTVITDSLCHEKIYPSLLRGAPPLKEGGITPETDPTLDPVTAVGTEMTTDGAPLAHLHPGAADQPTETETARAIAPPHTAAAVEATVAVAAAAPGAAGIRITGKKVAR